MDEMKLRLKAEIEKIGITRTAKFLEINRNTVYNWIAKGNIPLDRFMGLQELGINILYIMTGERSPSTPEQITNRILEEVEKTFSMVQFSQLSPTPGQFSRMVLSSLLQNPSKHNDIEMQESENRLDSE